MSYLKKYKIYLNNLKFYELLTHETKAYDTVLEHIIEPCTVINFQNKKHKIANNFFTVQDKKQNIKYDIFLNFKF
jgi:hypothetical protein